MNNNWYVALTSVFFLFFVLITSYWFACVEYFSTFTYDDNYRWFMQHDKVYGNIPPRPLTLFLVFTPELMLIAGVSLAVFLLLTKQRAYYVLKFVRLKRKYSSWLALRICTLTVMFSLLLNNLLYFDGILSCFNGVLRYDMSIITMRSVVLFLFLLLLLTCGGYFKYNESHEYGIWTLIVLFFPLLGLLFLLSVVDLFALGVCI